MIQYSGKARFDRKALAYWIPAFAGYDGLKEFNGQEKAT
jgi:hypothetical protein